MYSNLTNSKKYLVKLFNKNFQLLQNEYNKLFNGNSFIRIKDESILLKFYSEIQDNQDMFFNIDNSIFNKITLLQQINLHKHSKFINGNNKINIWKHIHQLYIIAQKLINKKLEIQNKEGQDINELVSKLGKSLSKLNSEPTELLNTQSSSNNNSKPDFNNLFSIASSLLYNTNLQNILIKDVLPEVQKYLDGQDLSKLKDLNPSDLLGMLSNNNGSNQENPLVDVFKNLTMSVGEKIDDKIKNGEINPSDFKL